MIDGVELRRRAEAAIAGSSVSARDDGASSSAKEAQAAIHELQVHQIELEMQNEDLRRAQAETEAERARYADFYDLAPAGYCTISKDALILNANLTAAFLFGIQRFRLPSQSLTRFIVKEDQDIFYLFRRRLFESGEARGCELTMVQEDGMPFAASIEGIEAREKGEAVARLVLSDISARKRTEVNLMRSLQENSRLLGEFEHRAKNSFALISSMINLASSACASPEAKGEFAQLDSRVRSVSELYALLDASAGLADVRLDDYCVRIAAPLADLANNISLNTEMESVSVPVKDATSIGLILTELVTNALKYAFPSGSAGTISLSLKKTAAGLRLEVADDGVGLPPGFCLSENSDMGLKLVQGLSRQVRAAFSIEGGPAGTRCVLDIAEASP